MLPEEVEAIRSEEDALNAYEESDRIKETKAPIEAKFQKMHNKIEEIQKRLDHKADWPESSESNLVLSRCEEVEQTITFVLRRGARVIKRHVMKRRR